jgi:2-polyprenyl-3-methyl-5-hydroxy-6-metoxy-1,4-benzoquinol methylase
VNGRRGSSIEPSRRGRLGHEAKATFGAVLHRLLQTAERILFGGYIRSLRLQARASGLPIPVTELGITHGSALTAGRGQGTISRWAAIAAALPAPPGFALDIGSHTGFFSLRLAERGFLVLGCEPSRRLFRIATAAADHAGALPVAFMPIALDPANVGSLPDADIVLALSVFDDWCERFGFEQSLEMLEAVWQRTRKVLFFETPNTAENASVRTFMPPMGASPQAAEAYLEQLLSGLAHGEVALLGHFPTDFRGEGEHRHLFVVRRR